jgi:hypothetical protein
MKTTILLTLTSYWLVSFYVGYGSGGNAFSSSGEGWTVYLFDNPIMPNISRRCGLALARIRFREDGNGADVFSDIF